MTDNDARIERWTRLNADAWDVDVHTLKTYGIGRIRVDVGNCFNGKPYCRVMIDDVIAESLVNNRQQVIGSAFGKAFIMWEAEHDK